MHRAYALLTALPHPTIHREIKNLLGGRQGNAPYLRAGPRMATRPPANGRAPS